MSNYTPDSGQLTGGVAHDFNNLLTVVSANLELIEKCAADARKVRRFAAAARHAAHRGAKLTAQLLTYSRRQILYPELVCASELIDEFQKIIRPALGGIELRVLSDEPLWLCYVDSSLLESALLNLALNARDAMPAGGSLIIETRNVVVSTGGCPPGSYVSISVTDTGCGMSTEARERIFEPFFSTKETKGTCLGLNMVFGFVQQSGGHLGVDSALGAGTTFTVYLPRAVQHIEVKTETIPTDGVPTGSERILLVEDDDDVLELTSTMLTQLGYQVICARSADQAKRMLTRKRHFDLLFSNIVMSAEMNGIELAREARRLSKNIKVLLTSAHTEDVLTRHEASSEFPVIAKPFRRADLAQRLRSILDAA
jgi:CheY-like chemotaxis protein